MMNNMQSNNTMSVEAIRESWNNNLKNTKYHSKDYNSKYFEGLNSSGAKSNHNTTMDFMKSSQNLETGGLNLSLV